MSAKPSPTVAVHLPADLVARLEELKKDRDQDSDKSVEQLIADMVRAYVFARESARQELAMKDELERHYREHPDIWDDREEWESLYQDEQANGRKGEAGQP